MKGLGIDTVSISRTRALIDSIGETYADGIYTLAERMESEKAMDCAEYFAERFAVKEALFKALAHLLEEKTFDLRIVETLDDADGCPRITRTPELEGLLDQAGASELFVSITTEDDAATAIVAVQ